MKLAAMRDAALDLTPLSSSSSSSPTTAALTSLRPADSLSTTAPTAATVGNTSTSTIAACTRGQPPSFSTPIDASVTGVSTACEGITPHRGFKNLSGPAPHPLLVSASACAAAFLPPPSPHPSLPPSTIPSVRTVAAATAATSVPSTVLSITPAPLTATTSSTAAVAANTTAVPSTTAAPSSSTIPSTATTAAASSSTTTPPTTAASYTPTLLPLTIAASYTTMPSTTVSSSSSPSTPSTAAASAARTAPTATAASFSSSSSTTTTTTAPTAAASSTPTAPSTAATSIATSTTSRIASTAAASVIPTASTSTAVASAARTAPSTSATAAASSSGNFLRAPLRESRGRALASHSSGAAAPTPSVAPSTSRFLYRRNDNTHSNKKGARSNADALGGRLRRNSAGGAAAAAAAGNRPTESRRSSTTTTQSDRTLQQQDVKHEKGEGDTPTQTLEEAIQRLIDGGAPKAKRLRLSSLRNSSRPLYVARLPESLSSLQQPISIQQDVISLGPGEKFPQHLEEAARRAAPWRLRDSSDLAYGGGGPSSSSSSSSSSAADAVPALPRSQKLFVSKPNDVNSDCFFLLVESEECIEVLPIDGWINFERCAPSKTTYALPSTADDAEQQSRSKAAREAALAARVAQLRRRSGESDDESSLKNRMRSRRHTGSLAERKPSTDPAAHLSADADELGLRRQRQKRMKQLLRQKAGQGEKLNEYINSALSLTVLRQAEVDWDYEEGERSDDEDDLAAEGKQQQGGTGDAADIYGDAAAADAPSDDDDAAGIGSTADLSHYGQKMKDLLAKAKDDEADDELHQYECDDDEDEGGGERVGGSPETAARAAAAAAAVRSTTGSSSSGVQGVPPKAVAPSADAAAVAAAAALKAAAAMGGASGGGGRATETMQELEGRVIRVMQQHMGRMSVRNFMTAFKVREKNEEFRRIQQIIHKICKVETTEEKQKFIILKPEFRM